MSTDIDTFISSVLPRLQDWMNARGFTDGPLQADKIGGGTQNLLLRLRSGDRRCVLRRCSLRSEDSAGTALRESRVLGALRDTTVPHPRFIAFCPDPDVIGSSFLLMEDVDGFCPRFGLPQEYHDDPNLTHRMGLSVVDAIVGLSQVDHLAAGLGDLGVAGWLDRQVDRWLGQLAGYDAVDGHRGERLPNSVEVGQWLSDHRPDDTRVGMVHGDYHLGNVIVSRHAPTVAAVVDWELVTIGDPLLDLGHLIVTWPKGGAGPAELAAALLPDRDELIKHYLRDTGRDPSAVRWFEVLAGFRLAIILEGSLARARAGQAPVEVGERLHRSAEVLIRAAAHRTVNDE